MRRARARYAALRQQAAAILTQPPAPEANTPRAPANPGEGHVAGPPRPQTARPSPGPDHGGIDYSLRVWKDGRIRMWDGAGNLVGRRECACPLLDLSDAAIERWLTDGV